MNRINIISIYLEYAHSFSSIFLCSLFIFQVPLVEGSNILCYKWKLDIYKNSYLKNPRRHVRLLMTDILGTEKLKVMSPTGGGGWTIIPTNVQSDVESKFQFRVERFLSPFQDFIV